MVTLSIATKANTAFTLPLYLAGAYAAHHGVEVDSVFKNTNSAGADKNFAELVARDGQILVDSAIIRYFLDHSPSNALKRNEIGEWIDRIQPLTVLDFKALEAPVKELESHLTLRSYMVGRSLTLADIVIWGALRGNRVIVGLRRNSQNINRWFSFIESTHPWLSAAVVEFYSQTQQANADSNPTGANYNIGLKNAENGIVCRFPPEPSGYLHIGHAKAALLNDYFAHEYGDRRGTLICRFDDTNLSKESQEFQDSILHDLSLLGVVPDRVTYSSDYFQPMYEACVGLITSGKAYADNTIKEVMQDQRMKGIASACRGMSVEETLAHFEQMKSSSQDGLQWCIRAKISIDNVNKAMRDPVIYRCNHRLHHRTGSAWKIYPTYDFCAPYLDSAEGVTHALRTNEYRDRNPQYHWIQNALGLRSVEIWDFSRLNFVRTVLSKRKLTTFVDDNVVWGWDDPRMPTVRGIRRRGCTIPALREFILKQGPSQNIVNMDWTQFWAVNKKYIDPVAARYTAIPKLDVVTAYIDGVGETTSAQWPKHKNPGLGTKEVIFANEVLIAQDDARQVKDGEVITLMNWGNAIVSSVTTEPTIGKILTIQLKLDLGSDPKTTEKKITWLAKEPRNMVQVDIYFFDHLITKDKIEKHDNINLFLTKRNEFRTEAWADCNVSNLRADDIIQFDRTGYFRVDQAYGEGRPAVLFNIPTGKGVGKVLEVW